MLRTIIIDDEADAIESLTVLLSDFIDGIELLGSAKGVDDGVQLINTLKPQLIFLDINMKDGTGFDLLNRFDKFPFQVIFVTAYDQYAVKAFKYAALDYLLKPIDLQELRNSVERARNFILTNNNPDYQFVRSVYKDPFPVKLALPNLEGFDLVEINRIIRCEGQNNYTTVLLEGGKKYLVSKTLKEYESILVLHGFIRVFQSHLINTKYIQRYIKGRGGTVIMSDGVHIPVSRDKKEFLLKVIKS